MRTREEAIGMGNGAADTLRGFARALESRDLEKTVGFFHSDAVYETPSGAFRGTAEIRRYFRWMFDTNSEIRITESGVGILVVGDKAVFDHVIRGIYRGQKWELPILCTYEFKDEKVKRMLTLFDRLSLARQVATGWMARWAVGAVVKGSEKGLR